MRVVSTAYDPEGRTTVLDLVPAVEGPPPLSRRAPRLFRKGLSCSPTTVN
ncbi:MAG: hypothetical protein ACLR7Z_15885 [Bilophila wadsworthia]